MAWEVFYYQTERGESPIEDFLTSLPRKAKAKCITYMDLLEEMGFDLPRSPFSDCQGSGGYLGATL